MKKFLVSILFISLMVAPALALAQEPCAPDYSSDPPKLCNALSNFFGKSVTDIPSFISAVLTWLASIIGTLALVMVIFSGARMVFSQGNETVIKEAKTSLTYSIIGLLVVMFAYVLVSALEYFLGVRTGLDPGTTSAPGFFINPLTDGNLQEFIVSTIKTFLSLIGTAAMLYIIIAGYRYVTAGGNEEQTAKAKSGITWAVVGLVSIILSYLIVTVVINAVKP